MGLEETCIDYKGRVVAVKPIYGWGWTRLDAPQIPGPAEANGVPLPFHCRIKDFFHFQDELRGAVGVIAEPGHIYDSLWVVFHTRLVGVYNFTDSPPHCDVRIGPMSPVGEWPEFTAGAPLVNGYGFAAKSFQRLKEYEARVLAEASGV